MSDAIDRYNERRKKRITKRANADWKDTFRDHGTLDEYDIMPKRAQSMVLNPPSAPRKPTPKELAKETENRLNSFRRRGNFGQLHAEIEGLPVGSSISYDGDDWVKDDDKWNPREGRPLRHTDFTKKLLQDGKDVEYDPNGNEKASKNTEEKMRGLWRAGNRGGLNKLLETRPEGSTLTIDGVEYRKDGYLKWENNGDKYGSRSITERMDKAKGKFTFNC